MAAWWTDVIENRVCLTITEENLHLLAILAEMDPEGDAIRVELGAFASTDEGAADQTVSYQTMPGGVPSEEEPMAVEPTVEDLPAYQEHSQPAREEPVSGADSPSYDPQA